MLSSSPLPSGLQRMQSRLTGTVGFISLAWTMYSISSFLLGSSSSITFSFDRNSFNSSMFDYSITPSGEAYYGTAATLGSNNTVWLIPDPAKTATNGDTACRIISTEQITFFNTSGAIMSFNTSFSFQIFTLSDSSGEGMAFFIAQFKAFPYASARGNLGLLNATSFPGDKFFAVEFDIALTPEFEDPSSSHVGIDINTLKSIQTFDTSNSTDLYLHQNSQFQAWIDFDASTNIVQVWLINSAASSLAHDPKGVEPILSTLIDPSVFNDTPMWVGITATSGIDADTSGYAIYSWEFSISDSTDNGELISKPIPPSNNDGNILIPPSNSGGGNIPGNPKKTRDSHELILGITLPVIFLICLLLLLLLLFLGYRSGSCPGSNAVFRSNRSELSAAHEAGSADNIQQFSYNALKRATDNFSEKMVLGEGGFSKVYKGLLSGHLVAIKKLKDTVKERGGEATFASEVRIISSIRHRNLLALRGWCYEKGKALLVYQYAENGSLEKLLYKTDKVESMGREVLTSDRRLKILVGIATALEYLHEGLGECVIHRDVKAANVLLTKEWEPMLGDFGLARLVSRDKMGATMTAAGTTGYIAPEVVYTGRATEKADVYSFGILALEMACGRRVLDFNLGPKESNLLEWVWGLYERDNIVESLDPCMLQIDAHGMDDEFKRAMKVWRGVIHVALNCCHPQIECRPSMREVKQALIEGGLLPLPMVHPNLYYPRSTNNEGPHVLSCASSNAPPNGDSSSIFSTSV